VNRPVGDDREASVLRLAHGTYRNVALYELPWEIEIGLRLAFYHTLAIPRIARLLAKSGETKERPLKRGIDTALLLYELIDSGTDSSPGREVLRVLNRVHRGWGIEPEDYEYVLATFIVVPVRFADRYGWRALTNGERESSALFYAEVGRLMGMRRLPASYTEAERWMDDYEAEHRAYSPEAAEIEQAIEHAVRRRIPWVPGPLAAPAARIVTQGLLGSRELCEALGVPAAPWAERTFYTGMRIRAEVVRLMPRRHQSWFRRTKLAGLVYPGGDYQLPMLGPARPGRPARPPSPPSDSIAISDYAGGHAPKGGQSV
jgi:hypothetical protein